MSPNDAPTEVWGIGWGHRRHLLLPDSRKGIAGQERGQAACGSHQLAYFSDSLNPWPYGSGRGTEGEHVMKEKPCSRCLKLSPGALL